MLFNPIALTKAKIAYVCNFGLSECNGVKARSSNICIKYATAHSYIRVFTIYRILPDRQTTDATGGVLVEKCETLFHMPSATSFLGLSHASSIQFNHYP